MREPSSLAGWLEPTAASEANNSEVRIAINQVAILASLRWLIAAAAATLAIINCCLRGFSPTGDRQASAGRFSANNRQWPAACQHGEPGELPFERCPFEGSWPSELSHRWSFSRLRQLSLQAVESQLRQVALCLFVVIFELMSSGVFVWRAAKLASELLLMPPLLLMPLAANVDGATFI